MKRRTIILSITAVLVCAVIVAVAQTGQIRAQSAAKAMLTHLAQGNWEQAFEFVAYHDGPADAEVRISYEEARDVWTGRLAALERQGIFLKDFRDLKVRMDDGWAQGHAAVTLVEQGTETVTDVRIGFMKREEGWRIAALQISPGSGEGGEWEKAVGGYVSKEADAPAEEQPAAGIPVPPAGERPVVQAGVAACGPEAPPSPKSRKLQTKPWPQIGPHQALEGIASISVGRVFDAAGYGWKPGISHAIAADGTAWYWGYGRSGQSADFPQQVPGLRQVRQISGAFALTAGGEVWSWDGENAPTRANHWNDVAAIQQLDEMFGTLAMLRQDGSVWMQDRQAAAPERLTRLEAVREIHGSSFSLFAVNEEGKLLYMDGRSGGDWLEREAVPVELPAPVVRVAVGFEDEALALTAEGHMYAFAPEEGAPRRMPLADGAKRMAVGAGIYWLIQEDGSVWGWGENRNGMLGGDRPNRVEEPVRIGGLADMADIRAGTDHVLALDKGGRVYAWGSNMTGQLGRMPILFDRWTEIGELDGIRQAAALPERPYLVREDGTVWGVDDDRTVYRVEGPSNVRALADVYGIPITLSDDGQVRLWPNQFAACQSLTVPFPVKDIAGGEGQLLLRSEDGRLVTVQFKPEIEQQSGGYVTTSIVPVKTAAAQTEGDWPGRVKSLYSNHYTFFALTEDGRVFYAELADGLPGRFRAVPELARIKELAPEYFVRYTLDPASVWALDEDGRVHEMIVTPVHAGRPELTAVQVSAISAAQEDGISFVSGRLRIERSGQLFERDWTPLPRQPVPEPVRLVSSRYAYAIEGPGSHYHLLVTQSGKLALLGYNPFGRAVSVPGQVVIAK